MKIFFPFLLVGLLKVSGVTAQKSVLLESRNSSMPKSGLYILDSVKQYRKVRVFAMDERDCYLQIEKDYAVVSYRIRGNTIFIAGKVTNPGLYVIEGDSIKTFTIVVDNQYSTSMGARYFFGIAENKLGKHFDIYRLNNREQILDIYKSHVATNEEKLQLLKRSKEQNPVSGF